MTDQHTPGPWHVDGHTVRAKDEHDIDWYITEACEQAGDGDIEANARLIAAAPAMLDALQAFQAYEDGGNDDAYERAVVLTRAAIAQATGTAGRTLAQAATEHAQRPVSGQNVDVRA